MKKNTAETITNLHKILPGLNSNQLKLVLDIINVLSEPFEKKFASNIWIFSIEIVDILADFVRIHHALSDEPFTKDKFEYALDRACKILGINSILPERTNPGHDIIIDNTRVSLKTQANKNIKKDFIHISKFMELGKGKWDEINDLYRFRDDFLRHMEDYEKIITMRCLSSKKERSEGLWHYEIVEIPKSLLFKASSGYFEMKTKSIQNPKPGYCYIKENGKDLFQLYFDGGSERKLQVKNLDKKYCNILADFIFRK